MGGQICGLHFHVHLLVPWLYKNKLLSLQTLNLLLVCNCHLVIVERLVRLVTMNWTVTCTCGLAGDFFLLAGGPTMPVWLMMRV